MSLPFFCHLLMRLFHGILEDLFFILVSVFTISRNLVEISSYANLVLPNLVLSRFCISCIFLLVSCFSCFLVFLTLFFLFLVEKLCFSTRFRFTPISCLKFHLVSHFSPISCPISRSMSRLVLFSENWSYPPLPQGDGLVKNGFQSVFWSLWHFPCI